MATHFFGLTQRTFGFSHSIGRNEFAGTGLRNPVDFAVAPDDTVYIVNRSYENRPDGCRISIFTRDEEYITATLTLIKTLTISSRVFGMRIGGGSSSGAPNPTTVTSRIFRRMPSSCISTGTTWRGR